MQDPKPAISPDPSCIGVYSTLFVLFLATLHKDSVPGKNLAGFAYFCIRFAMELFHPSLPSNAPPHIRLAGNVFQSSFSIISWHSHNVVSIFCMRMYANVREFLKVLCNSVFPVSTNRARNIVSFEKVQRPSFTPDSGAAEVHFRLQLQRSPVIPLLLEVRNYCAT
jgi:hypothetical protein